MNKIGHVFIIANKSINKLYSLTICKNVLIEENSFYIELGKDEIYCKSIGILINYFKKNSKQISKTKLNG